MSVRPDFVPPPQTLSSGEGELVSVQICVKPHLLESLLDVLAGVGFPVNPQIYHQAGVGYVYADGHEEVEPVTIVEFPAYSKHLAEVRQVVKSGGLDPASVHVRSMLADIHSVQRGEAVPDGAAYCRLNLYKELPATVSGASRFV